MGHYCHLLRQELQGRNGRYVMVSRRNEKVAEFSLGIEVPIDQPGGRLSRYEVWHLSKWSGLEVTDLRVMRLLG